MPGLTMKITTTKVIIGILALWLIVVYFFFSVFALGSDAKARAMLGMVSGLILLWIVIGGIAMYTFRDQVKALVRPLPGDWRLKFIVFAIVMALLEEAVTTGMTNLAPFFGVKIGEAYITASANYLDVVMFHSVIVFIPMFIAWAFLLSKYDFSPVAVFLLFGVTGTLCESVTFGLQNLTMFGMWAFVYGLMVYLPAYTLPGDRIVKKPKLWHYILAIVLPILIAIPVAVIVSMIHPVSIHFPPI
jgi:hypothetical protein